MAEPKPNLPPRDKPSGAPPGQEKPRIVPPQQFTLEPGDHGRGDGPLHREPLVKDAKMQDHYGRGTYGNDQFAAEHHDDFVADAALPEGLQDSRQQLRGSPERPTLKPKEKRYGRLGDEGKG